MKNKNKFIIVIISLIILGISSFLRFIIVAQLKSIFTYEIKGTYLALLGSTLLAVSIYRKKNLFVGYLISFSGYIYTFYTLYSFKTGLSKDLYKLDYGFYFYVISFVVMLISLFFYENKEQKINNNNNNFEVENIEKNLEIDNLDYNKQLVLGNLILGFKDMKYNSVVALVNDTKNNSLYLVSKNGDMIDKNEISYSNIKNIKYKPDIMYKETKTVNTADQESMNYILSALFISSNPIIATGASGLINKITEDYDKISFKQFFQLEIKFVNNEEEMSLIIRTSKEPKDFVEEINKILP